MKKARTVFKVQYRVSPNENYKEFKTPFEITDTGTAIQVRDRVGKLKGTKDVYISTSRVRNKLDGTIVSEPYNYLLKK